MAVGRSGWILAAALAAAACGGGEEPDGGGAVDESVTVESPATTDEHDDEPDSGASTTLPVSTVPPTTSPGLAVLTSSIDPETGEFVEEEVAPPGPTTLSGAVDAGIAAGIWDEVDGLTRAIGYAVGAIPAEQMPGAAEALTGEVSELLRRANALALGDTYSDDELAGLRRVYELAAPPFEKIAAAAAPAEGSGEPQGIRSPRRTPRQSSECTPVDPADFSGWAVAEGCYRLIEDAVAGATLRVLYPAWYDEDEQLAALPGLALQSLVHSTATFERFGDVGDIDLVFSLVDTIGSDGTLAVASDTALWDMATIAGACPITIFPNAFEGEGPFLQTVSHEAWHCVQWYSGYPEAVADGHEWYVEGGAQYFSNVAYPGVDDEHVWFSTFDDDSRTNPLFDLSYDAWIWWQYLANGSSPTAVAELQHTISRAGDGGKLAMKGYEQRFQRFVVEFMAGTIADASGERLPIGQRYIRPAKEVAKGDKGKRLEFEASNFVATRWRISYDKELRVLQSDRTETSGEVAMVETAKRRELGEWKEIFPEVRSKCTKKRNYFLVATTGEDPHKPVIEIDKVDQAVCDPCVIGTWRLDLDSFEAMLVSMMAQQGGMPAGLAIELSGNYLISMDDEGVVTEQRDGFTFTGDMGGMGIAVTIDSFAAGQYEADGENLSTIDLTEEYVNTSVNIPVLGSMNFGHDVSALSAEAMYECDDEELLLTVPGFEPTNWVRVDKILQPANTIPAG